MPEEKKVNEELPTIREALTKAFEDADEVETKTEEVDDGEQGGSSGVEEERVLHGEGREESERDERSGESAGAEAELDGEEEGGDEEHVLTGSDDDPEEHDEEGQDEEEDEEGREEGEVAELPPGEVDPIESWPEDVKAEFAKMPPKAQEFYLGSFKGMVSDYTKKVTEVADIRRAIDPVREELTRTGISEGEMIRRFVAVHKRLEDDPAAAVKWVADLYGVDVAAPAAAAGETPAPVDPRVDRIEEHITAQQRSDAHARAVSANEEILKLKGEGKMPLYDTAEPLMIQEVQKLQASGQHIPSIMDIYDQVVWATPSLREKHLANIKAQEAKEKIEDKKTNIAKSKRAAGKGPTSRKPSTSFKKKKKMTLREELSARYDEAARASN